VRLSKLFTKTLKNAPSDQDSLNGRLLTRAGFIHQETSGVYSFLPLGFRVLNKIEQIIREEMTKIGGQEVLMSALSPTDYWQTTGRLEGISVLFKAVGANKLSELNNDKAYILNPTHEDEITPICKRYIFSYKDLPVLPFHIQTKFRNEPRARGGLLRTREFRMKDLYSFHPDDASFLEFYTQASEAYATVFKRLGLGDKTYYTVASGGDFTKKNSHEFQTVMENGEDTIYICRHCTSPHGAGLAYNKEVVADSSTFKCPECGNSDFDVVRASEVGNIFPLETRFTEAFGLQFTDHDGSLKSPIMGSYGIGPSRVMGVLAEVFSDAKGLCWPESVAPFKVHLIDIKGQRTDDRIQMTDSGRQKTERGSAEAEEAYNKLTQSGTEVLFDDRSEASAGEKFADADLIGVPYQIIVSSKSQAAGGVEFRKRGDRQGQIFTNDQLLDQLKH